MQKVKSWLMNFMMGRNGPDQLNTWLLWLYLVLVLVRTVAVIIVPRPIVYHIFSTLLLVVLFVMLFRMFSRDLAKRRQENQMFLEWWMPKKRAARSARIRLTDRQHRYYKCKNCGAWCRVPKGKGKIELRCPRCGTSRIVKS